MRLSDLQNKDIVSLYDGKNIGNIVDVNIDEKTGSIISFVIEPNKKMFSLFTRSSVDAEIRWQSIEKIGEDVILVKTNI